MITKCLLMFGKIKQKYLVIFIIALSLISYLGIKKIRHHYLISQQEKQVAQSEAALLSYSNHYFKCSPESAQALESFMKNHELKLENLIALDQSKMFSVISKWDEEKDKLEEKIEQCKASLP